MAETENENGIDELRLQGIDVDAKAEESLPDDGEEKVSAAKMNIHLSSFEGPFDLLLTLLSRQKIEITDIPISVIADQYIDIIFAAGGFNADIASEFLVMASMLLHMKTRELLPKPLPETDEMTEEELKAHLLKYKQYKELAVKLDEQMVYWNGALYRAQENIDFPKKEETVQLSGETLADMYSRAKLRFDTLRNDNTEKMETILKIERVSLKDKIKQIIGSLVNKAKVRFSEIFIKGKSSKPEMVTGFMATLELNKRTNVKVTQKELFGEIEIERTDGDLSADMLELDEYKEWE